MLEPSLIFKETRSIMKGLKFSGIKGTFRARLYLIKHTVKAKCLRNPFLKQEQAYSTRLISTNQNLCKFNSRRGQAPPQAGCISALLLALKS